MAAFFPSGKPFFKDEDPNVVGEYNEISCATNFANVKCYYYGNGDMHSGTISKGYYGNWFLIDTVNATGIDSSN